MPQELYVGHRSTLVSGLAWALMVLGVAALGLLAWRSGYVRSAFDTLILSLPACGALLMLAVGQALLRRYEWGRKLALLLLVLAIAALPVVPALTIGNAWFVALGLAVSLALIWLARMLGRPVVKQEFA